MSSVQRGIVKQVLSGDTIVIRAPGNVLPPPERTLSLSNVTAPRLARKQDGVEVNDEPFAFASREFLRKRLVGKEVQFTVDYKTPQGREYVTMTVAGAGGVGENVAKLLLVEGWVKLREGSRLAPEELAEYTALSSNAEAKKQGIFGDASTPGAVRTIQYNADPRTLVDTYKGKPVDALIEQVRDGASFRVLLVPSFVNITFILSGVKCPTIKQGEDKKEIVEPYANEAKFFSESRLLQREVKVVLEGVQNQSVVGSILHPAGNIAEFLLVEGLAKVVDWSIGIVSQGRDKYRTAEKVAKDKKLRLWKDHQSTAPKQAINDAKFTGTVVEVMSPEQVVVKVGDIYKRVSFASIRQPRIEEKKEAGAEVKETKGDKEGKGKKPLYDVPYFFEAREFLRKKLIGKSVDVSVDYIRPGNDNFPERICATVKVGGVNVGEALVSKGLATVLRHKQSDEDRSSNYDDLLAAESNAIKNQVGVHSKKQHPPMHVNDIATLEIANRYLNSFKRAERLTGIVEHVISGSRLKVYVVKESCLATIVLAGITCPRSGKDGKTEPFAEEALSFTKNKLYQHEVELDIEDVDKTGAFIGHVFVSGSNLASSLLEEGYAQVHSSSSKYKNSIELATVEERAKKAKKGLWLTYVEPVKVEAKPVESSKTIESEKVLVSEVSSANVFWAQPVSAASTIEEITNELRSILAKTTPAPHTPKVNELVAAKFTADDLWYRAKVLNIPSATTTEVRYVDYGNSEVVSNNRLTALPAVSGRVGPQAKQYHIAAVNSPPQEWAESTKSGVAETLLDKTVNVSVLYTDGSDQYVSVTDAETNENVILSLVQSGLLAVQKRREGHLKDFVSSLEQAQSSARKDRIGMWVYGDVTSDDAKEFGYSSAPKK